MDPDATIRFLRYMPDGFAVHAGTQQGWFVDAKVGRSIEKDAYLVYTAFAGDDRNVCVYVKSGMDVYVVSARDLRFLDSSEYVGRFSPDDRMPIDEAGWIAPRLWPRQKYLMWKRNHPEASGTAFKYLDLDSMASHRRSGLM